MPIIDVQNPTQPVLLHQENPLDLIPIEGFVKARGSRLYLFAVAPVRLFVIDITDARAEGFTKSGKTVRTPDTVISDLLFPASAQGLLRDFALGNGAIYVAQTGQASGDAGSLDVIDIRDETQPQLGISLQLPTRQASGVALLGDVVYVAAGKAGLLAYDIRDPLEPILLTSVAGDPDLDDGVDLALTSKLTIEGDFAYVVQTEFDHHTRRQTDRLLVVDLQQRTAPRLRGSLPLRVASAEPTAPSA